MKKPGKRSRAIKKLGRGFPSETTNCGLPFYAVGKSPRVFARGSDIRMVFATRYIKIAFFAWFVRSLYQPNLYMSSVLRQKSQIFLHNFINHPPPPPCARYEGVAAMLRGGLSWLPYVRGGWHEPRRVTEGVLVIWNDTPSVAQEQRASSPSRGSQAHALSFRAERKRSREISY